MKVLQLYYPNERIDLPKEDAWAVDLKNNAFAVADGVHLLPGIEYPRGEHYPSPSPAGRLAREFCNNFITFQKNESLARAFAAANRSVLSVNKNRDKSRVLLGAQAYYAATAATGRIKNKILELRGICDSSITILGPRGEILFSHTDHVHHNEFDPLLSRCFHLDASYMQRTIFRNALSPRGKKLGYGVITGEREAEAYVWSGKRKVHKGEVVIFATDGFEKYFEQTSFRKMLLTMDKEAVRSVVEQLKIKHGSNRDFASEKTLIAVQVE